MGFILSWRNLDEDILWGVMPLINLKGGFACCGREDQVYPWDS